MTAVSNHFYVTQFSNSSNKIYEENTLSTFTIKIVQPIELNSVENWEVGICEISCPPSILGTGMTLITMRGYLVLVYCNLSYPQFLGNDVVPCLATYIFPSTN